MAGNNNGVMVVNALNDYNINNKRYFERGDGQQMSANTNLTDFHLVHKASAWLGISEFQLFSEAWQAWYSEKPSDKRLEPYFANYLVGHSVPFWVRNYVRSIISREDLIARERKRLVIGALTYYLPLIIFLVIILWALSR